MSEDTHSSSVASHYFEMDHKFVLVAAAYTRTMTPAAHEIYVAVCGTITLAA
jgi:hypothetical protein